MRPNKILILGVTGMLGNSLYRYFRDRTFYNILGVSRSSIAAPTMYQTKSSSLLTGIDVENIDSLVQVLTKYRPDVVINCVGIIKQRNEVDDPLTVLPINSLFPHRLSQLCSLLGARLIHISTDCVFSGKKGKYLEEDLPDARDLYGRSKLLGEVIDSHAITIRTSMIGHELYDNKSLVNWFLSQTGTVRGYRRAIFSGFPTVEIARIIDQYIIPNISLHGLIQISADPIDKYTLLGLIKDIYGTSIQIQLDDSVVIDRSLDSSRFKQLTGYQAPSWNELISAMFDFK